MRSEDWALTGKTVAESQCHVIMSTTGNADQRQNYRYRQSKGRLPFTAIHKPYLGFHLGACGRSEDEDHLTASTSAHSTLRDARVRLFRVEIFARKAPRFEPPGKKFMVWGGINRPTGYQRMRA